jgi:hypothetical protein
MSMASNDSYDPNKIDVSLSLLSGKDTDAAKDLAKQLESVAGHFESIHKSFSGYEDKLAKIAQQLEKITTGATDSGASTPQKAKAAQRGEPDPDTPRPPPDTQRPPTPEEARRATADASRPSYYVPDDENDDARAHADWGEDGGGASRPPGSKAQGRAADWIVQGYNASRYPNAPESSAVGFFQKHIGGLIGGSLDDDTLHDLSEGEIGPMAAAFRNPINTYFGAKALGDTARTVANRFPELRFTSGADAAMDAGYARGGDLNVGPFSFKNPLSGEAAGEAWRQMKNSFHARIEAGITAEDAQRMNVQLEEAGMTGDMGQHAYNRLLKPMWQGYKMDPAIITKFLGSVRTGEQTFDDLKKQMEGLANSSRAAQISVQAMAEGAAQVGELNQSLGGTFRAGTDKATAFSNSTGLAPDRLASLMQNPMVQGMMSVQSGLPPQLQGVLGTGATMGAVDQAMDLQEQIGRSVGAGMGQIRTPIKDPATGQVIGYEKVSQKKIGEAYAASSLGLSPEEYHKMRRHEKEVEAGGALESVLQDPKMAAKVGDTEIMSLAKQAGVSQKYMDEARSATTFDAGRKKLEEGLREARRGDTRKDQLAAKVQIDLSPAARQLFNIDGKDSVVKALKADANAGKGTMTGATNGPRGPIPLIGGRAHPPSRP